LHIIVVLLLLLLVVAEFDLLDLASGWWVSLCNKQQGYRTNAP
jgi:hypothetical protein